RQHARELVADRRFELILTHVAGAASALETARVAAPAAVVPVSAAVERLPHHRRPALDAADVPAQAKASVGLGAAFPAGGVRHDRAGELPRVSIDDWRGGIFDLNPLALIAQDHAAPLLARVRVAQERDLGAAIHRAAG